MNDILSQFEISHVRSDGRYMARCPAHEDNTPSLEIWIRPDKTLIKCFAGCKIDDILRRAGLRMRDLYPNSSTGRKDEKSEIYRYRYEDGSIAYESIRLTSSEGSKRFVQRQPDPKGNGWTYSLDGRRRVLYQLPALLKRIKDKDYRPVFIVEGEKKVESLLELGFPATCGVGGCNADWLDSYSQTLSGCEVCLCPDNDEPGYRFMMRVFGSLAYWDTVGIRWWDCPIQEKGADIYDFINSFGPTERDRLVAGAELLKQVSKLPVWRCNRDQG
ncbi:MAG: hypothetical protein HC888_00570 [Candidatus Competibacteraceae bacterium]|nr:hypothetical protein [Candidatus Competibacteraceae bacterium]